MVIEQLGTCPIALTNTLDCTAKGEAVVPIVASPVSTARAAGPDSAAPRAGQPESVWRLILPASFFDQSRNPMPAGARSLLLAIEDGCRSAPFTFAGNPHFARFTGLKDSAIQAALLWLIAHGWVHPVYTDACKRSRLGIILLRRPTSGALPAADTPERLAIVERRVRERHRFDPADREFWARELAVDVRPQPGAPGPAPTRLAGHPVPIRPGTEAMHLPAQPGQNKQSSRNHAPNNDAPDLGRPDPLADLRHDQEPPPAAPLPAAAEVEPELAVAPQAIRFEAPVAIRDSGQGLSRRQAAWIDKLSPAERDQLARMDAASRATVLVMVESGDRRREKAARRLVEPPVEARAPAPLQPDAVPPGATLLDLAAALSERHNHADARLHRRFAETLAARFGSKADRTFCFPSFVKIAQAVSARQIHPDEINKSLIAALTRDGVENKGAYFHQCLKNELDDWTPDELAGAGLATRTGARPRRMARC